MLKKNNLRFLQPDNLRDFSWNLWGRARVRSEKEGNENRKVVEPN